MNGRLAETIATSVASDEDSSLHLDKVLEADGSVAIALWGTEDEAPDERLAYTYLPEAEFIAWLERAGYRVEARQ